MLATAALFVLCVVANVQVASGKVGSRGQSSLGMSSTPGAQGGSTCKANKLTRLLILKLKRHVTKLRVKPRNGEIKWMRGESEAQTLPDTPQPYFSWENLGELGKLTDSQLDHLIEGFEEQLENIEKQKDCVGGAEVEEQLVKMIDIVRDMKMVEKIENRMNAKISTVMEEEELLQKGANGGKDYIFFDLLHHGLHVGGHILKVL